MVPEKQQPVEKKAYTKPQLTEVRLAAEEAVLGICKYNNGNMANAQGIALAINRIPAFNFIGLYCPETCPRTNSSDRGYWFATGCEAGLGICPGSTFHSVCLIEPPQASYYVQIDPIPTEPPGHPVFFLKMAGALSTSRPMDHLDSLAGLDPYLAGNFSHHSLRRNLYI